MSEVVVLTMGNPNIPEVTRDPDTDEATVSFTPADPETVTTIEFPADLSITEMFQTVTLPGGVGSWHFEESGPPTWVSCPDSSSLATLLGDHYGCEVR